MTPGAPQTLDSDVDPALASIGREPDAWLTPEPAGPLRIVPSGDVASDARPGEGDDESPSSPDVHQLFRVFDAAAGLLALVWVVVGVSVPTWPGLGAVLTHAFSFLDILCLGAGCLAWTQLLYLLGLHDPLIPLTRRQVGLSVAMAGAFGGGLVAVLLALGGMAPLRAAVLGMGFFSITTPTALTSRFLLRWITARARRLAPHATVIIGSGPMASRAAERIRRRNGDDTVLGYFDDLPGRDLNESEQWLGRIEDLERFLMWHTVDEVVVALPVKSFYAEIQRVVGVCERTGIHCRHSAHFFTSLVARPRMEPGATVALIPAPDDARLLVKRGIDILVSAMALVALAPVFLACAAAIWISGGGPVFFVQERYGYRKRCFRMYKFRTMERDAQGRQKVLECMNETQGATFKMRNDPRVTPLGRFLRRTSLDELPQLINVLRGDMSLVGPRPLPVRDVRNFEAAHLMRRFSVAPGITGLWQVSGRSNLTFLDWMGLDLEYVDRWSLGLDMSILLRTLPAVMRGEGAV